MFNPVSFAQGLTPAGASGLMTQAAHSRQTAGRRLGELAPVVHEETARARELVRLARDHPEREFLVRQVRPGQLQRLGHIVRVDVDRVDDLSIRRA